MLENLQPPKKKSHCGVRALLDRLEKKDQDALIAALANPEWTHKGLARELTKRGLAVSDTPIRKHRAKECSCAR